MTYCTPMSWERRLNHWALHALRPLSVLEVRIVYVALLIVGLYSSTLLSKAPELVAGTEPFLLRPLPVLSALGVTKLSPQTLGVIRAVTGGALLCSLVGLFSWWPRALLAMGATILYLAALTTQGICHNWHLATATLWFACLGRTGGAGTLDHRLARRWAAYPFGRPQREGTTSLRETGLARRLISIAAVAMLFAGGASKLSDAGLAWGDGETLRFYIIKTAEVLLKPRWPWLAALLLRHPGLLQFASMMTLLFEVGSIVALFSRAGRNLIIIGSIVFHIGIWCVMYPNFWPSIACYLLLIDWQRTPKLFRSKVDGVPAAEAVPPVLSHRIAAYSCLAYCVLWIATIVLRIDSYPFTDVPMYATYMSSQKVDRWPIQDMTDSKKLPAISYELLHRESMAGTTYIWLNAKFFLIDAEGRKLDVTKSIYSGLKLVGRQHLSLVVLRFFADGNGATANEFVSNCLEMLRRKDGKVSAGYHSLNLTYPVDGAEHIVGQAQF